MSTAATAEQTVVVEDVGPSRKRLTITIPGDAVTDQLETSLATVAAEAQVPGFRRGRVPRNLIEKRFGQLVRTEAKNQLVASAYSQAIERHKLRVIGEPDGGEALKNLELRSGEPVTFSVEVEVVPEFDLPDFSSIEVLKPDLRVSDEAVAHQIERLRLNEGTLESQPQAAPGDYCIGKGVMRDMSGNVVLELDGAVIQVPTPEKKGKGAILGLLVEDFGQQIGLPKAEDKLKVRAKGPENHEDARIRGQDVEIEFDVQRVERIIPATMEQLLSRAGFADEAQLRESVQLQMSQRVMIEQQALMRQQIAAKLVDSVKMDLPENITGGQAKRNIERARMEMMYRGMDPSEVEQRLAELRASSRETAIRELKLFFILAKVAEQMNVQVTEQEVGGRVAQIASERGVRADELWQELIKNNQLQVIAQQVREHKTLDAILAKARVKEVSAEEFEKAMRKKAAG